MIRKTKISIQILRNSLNIKIAVSRFSVKFVLNKNLSKVQCVIYWELRVSPNNKKAPIYAVMMQRLKGI